MGFRAWGAPAIKPEKTFLTGTPPYLPGIRKLEDGAHPKSLEKSDLGGCLPKQGDPNIDLKSLL